MMSAQEIYQTQIRQLPLAERLRLAAILLNYFQKIPDIPAALSVIDAPRPKRGSGKLDISYIADDFDALLEEMREYSNASPASTRDPFDRLLIAQNIANGMTFVTGDAQSALYPASLPWN